jgi:putative radical SAM enzyme (TIGR03279 family)
MRAHNKLEIESVEAGSPAAKAGLQPGDVLLSINSCPLRDVIDFMFNKGSDELEIEFMRHAAKGKVLISTEHEADLGITVKPFKIKICRNNCIFCFVKQLPKGLRKSLYIKDEDYRLSFLYGNYMTLSNITPGDKKRILEQRLSPLYISVHTTNRSLRNKMLGNPHAQDIMKELKFFSGNKIRMHIQIVLCPGFNDARELQRTIKDIYKFYPYVSSVAVVPVGLTRHRRHQLQPVTKDDALAAIAVVDSFQKRFKKKHGEPIVYCADEMYIKAGKTFPPLKEYGGLSQLENGVGMVPLFISQAKKTRFPKTPPGNKNILTFTGSSFFPYLTKFINRITEQTNINITVIPVENEFFGRSVTVTGLLTGRDIIKAVHDNECSHAILIVPDVVLKEGDNVLLDNVSLKDIEDATGLRTVVTDGTPQGLIDTIYKC